MLERIRSRLGTGSVLLLGYGREGRSSRAFLQSHFPDIPLLIADRRLPADETLAGVTAWTGDNYLDSISHAAVVMKSPGISLSRSIRDDLGARLTSQSDLFLDATRRPTIGITGSAGNSTTSSLTHHLLRTGQMESRLIGNIGIPPLDVLPDLEETSVVVFELSSHQLQSIHRSPSLAVFLNFFPEHLDYYESVDE
ncbi:MAG: hypothetical protein KDD44_15040, partial [Bdellovibrionales bacterium]|nr:hypothetical protein [Bdellovibrionales bacterium]